VQIKNEVVYGGYILRAASVLERVMKIPFVMPDELLSEV